MQSEIHQVHLYFAILTPRLLWCFSGYIWKDQQDGIQSLLRDDEMPLDKLLIESDAPFMFPFVDKVSFAARSNLLFDFHISFKYL